MEPSAGAMLILVRTASPTLATVDEEIEPEVAVTVAVPSPELVARPFEPMVLLITSTVADEELHTTTGVTSCVVPSEYVPVAVNC